MNTAAGAYLTFSVTQLAGLEPEISSKRKNSRPNMSVGSDTLRVRGLSGITALFCFGVVLAHYNWYNLSECSKVASKVIFGTVAKLAEAAVFVYLGVVAALSLGRFHWHFGCTAFTFVAIVVARAAHAAGRKL